MSEQEEKKDINFQVVNEGFSTREAIEEASAVCTARFRSVARAVL